MKKTLLITVIAGIVLMAGIGTAIMTSYGSITGLATIQQSILLDIMGSSNDTYYDISGYQGETIYSPQIKLNNRANVNITVNITVYPVDGNYTDVNLSITDNTTTNTTIGNIITVPTTDKYIYIRHEFYPNSSVGNYTFSISANPV